jgi:hypothetical protein
MADRGFGGPWIDVDDHFADQLFPAPDGDVQVRLVEGQERGVRAAWARWASPSVRYPVFCRGVEQQRR